MYSFIITLYTQRISKSGVWNLNQASGAMQPDLKAGNTSEDKTNFWNTLCINAVIFLPTTRS